MTVAPGWYPDPATGRELRWWDGQQWTHRTQPLPASQSPGERAGGWWMRGLALLVDGLAVGAVGAIVSLPAQIAVQRDLQAVGRDLAESRIGLDGYLSATAETYADHLVGILLVPLLVTVVYHAAFLRWRGATPGKLVCGLRVRPADGEGPLGWGTILTRIAVQYVAISLCWVLVAVSGSLAAFVLTYLAIVAYLAIDYLWAARAGRRTVHDLLAGTVVVRTR